MTAAAAKPSPMPNRGPAPGAIMVERPIRAGAARPSGITGGCSATSTVVLSFIACYASDLEVARSGRYRASDASTPETDRLKDEFDAAFRFAAKYAGYHASPRQSPGAWVAFREGDTLTGDYTFLMQRLPDRTREVKKAGPDDQRFGALARLLPRDETLQLALDDTFAASLATQTAELRVTYLDRGAGSFDVQTAGRTFHASCADSGRWKTIIWDLSRPLFTKVVSGAHVILRAHEADLILHMVEVTRKSTPSTVRTPLKPD